MKCKNCGSEVNETEKFCRQCGTKIELEPSQPATMDPPSESPQSSTSPCEDSKPLEMPSYPSASIHPTHKPDEQIPVSTTASSIQKSKSHGLIFLLLFTCILVLGGALGYLFVQQKEFETSIRRNLADINRSLDATKTVLDEIPPSTVVLSDDERGFKIISCPGGLFSIRLANFTPEKGGTLAEFEIVNLLATAMGGVKLDITYETFGMRTGKISAKFDRPLPPARSSVFRAHVKQDKEDLKEFRIKISVNGMYFD